MFFKKYKALTTHENQEIFLSFFLFSLLISLKLSINLHFSLFSVHFGLFFLTYFSGSLLLSLPFFFISRPFHYLYGLILFALQVFNHEHILINNGHLNFGFWHLGSSAVFINSLFHFGLLINFLYLGTFLSISSLISHYWFKLKTRILNRFILLELSIFLLVFDFFIPKDISVPQWQQSSFLTSTLKTFSPYELKDKSERTLRVNNPLDFSVIKKKPDIYLFILESFSQEYLDSGLAKNLKKLEKKSLHFKYFISNQQQTNRGLYSLFCGKYPNFLNLEAKSDILISSLTKQKEQCLPTSLKELGYTNYFLQSAPLSFMGKDDFSRAIGFDFAVGSEEYPTSQIISPWGVDDITTMESFYTTATEKESPKFVSVLTISTHYPYKTKESEGSLFDAIKYTDLVISKTVQKIMESKKDALIFITSDESRPLAPNLPLIRANRGLFLAVGGNLKTKSLSQVYSLKDFPLILHKVLNNRVSDLEETREEPLYFGNVYTNRIYSFGPLKKELTICNRELYCVTHKNIYNPFQSIPKSFSKTSIRKLNEIKEFLSTNEWFFGKTLFKKKDISLRARKTFNVFREYKFNPKKQYLKLEIKPENDLKVSFTAYECGKPKTQIVKHFKAEPKANQIILPMANQNTQCLSLYLKSFYSQKVSSIEISIIGEKGE